MFVGIDVSKKKHDVCIYDKEHEKYISFQIPNSRDGFEKFVSKISKDDVIAMEATGIYHESLYKFLDSNGYKVIILHPYQVKNISKTMNNSKNDRLDAKSIAVIISDFSAKLKKIKIPSNKIQSLREIVRHRNYVSSMLANLERKLRRELFLVMPEIEKYFSDMLSPVLLELLEKYPTPSKIISSFDEVRKIVGWTEDKVNKFEVDVRKSIGIEDEDGIYAFVVVSLVKDIKHLLEGLSEIEEKIKLLTEDIPESKNLMTIKGVGLMTAATIIAEIGDIERFDTKQQLTSYVGLDPVKIQSGQFSKNLHISKKGSKVLRKSLYFLAVRLVRYDKRFRDFYKRLRERGKNPRLALVAVARKALEIIFHILKTGEEYVPLTS
ncbi:MAG: IS110 family transposase [Thermotogae bacterium]|nr:IS110 family transposase [Thermotogota bacterium]